jgi:photosystem II stability/assembly factor-like uncharacterized protein
MSLIIEDIQPNFFCFDVMPDGSIIGSVNNAGTYTGGTLLRSVDDGVTWTVLWTHPDSANIRGGQLVFVDSRGYIFAKFSYPAGDDPRSANVWRSTDGGQSFSIILEGESNEPCFAEDAIGYLYAATGQGPVCEVWRSIDGGLNWLKVWDDKINDDGNTKHSHGLIVDPVTDWVYHMEGEWIGSATPSRIWRSKDRGATWYQVLSLDGNVNPSWVPMGLTIFKGQFYFGSDRPNDNPDYIYRFTDNGLDIHQNIAAEQVYAIDAWIAFWLRTTPSGTR